MNILSYVPSWSTFHRNSAPINRIIGMIMLYKPTMGSLTERVRKTTSIKLSHKIHNALICSDILQCNVTFCSSNVHMFAHICYKIVSGPRGIVFAAQNIFWAEGNIVVLSGTLLCYVWITYRSQTHTIQPGPPLLCIIRGFLTKLSIILEIEGIRLRKPRGFLSKGKSDANIPT